MDKRITEILAIPFVHPKLFREHHGNIYLSNRKLRSCYVLWKNAFEKHVSLKVAVPFRYEKHTIIRAPWDNALEALEASLEHFKAKVDLFLPESYVAILKLEDTTNLSHLFGQIEQCCHMIVKMHLEETPEFGFVL
ncbi:unnamed protein product [Prunus armeniaca]|uniref:Uncharacterized protein n=1 Tax=Prunus armeniaca TaxID=36596 RepID=A0A6J5VF28_PRUAR|nr:unnamed protein product [Prunus armeniaca]